jgi:hypothetical protein
MTDEQKAKEEPVVTVTWKFLKALLQVAGQQIDPETAEVDWDYAEVLDPYGLFPPEEQYSCVGRAYFARAPGSNVWVEFGDLPDATRESLWRRHSSKLAFPAGLCPVFPEELDDETAG